MSQTVSQAYLIGISEGRALLRQFQLDGIATRDTFAAALANCEALLRQGFAGEMRDCFRGERDFWRGQCAKFGKEYCDGLQDSRI